MDLLARIARPRPVGTALNNEITDFIGSYLESFGYEINRIPFGCKVWETNESFLVVDGIKLPLHVNPFSESFIGTGKAFVARNFEELKKADCKDKILFLTEDLSTGTIAAKRLSVLLS